VALHSAMEAERQIWLT